MIQIIRRGEDLSSVLNRTQLDFDSVNSAVAEILSAVRKKGDVALLSYAERFDGGAPKSLVVSEAEIAAAYECVDAALLSALRRAKENILAYHKKQLIAGADFEEGGRRMGWLFRPVKRAGVYVPGGTAAYPSSVLMTALAAKAADVEEIYMVTPEKDGVINPLSIVAASECGVKNIFKTGGAQAIAALAFGTETVPKVDVIAGPGNIFVTVAKKQVYGYVGIDMIAGPSEILIIADDSANAEYLAADLLSQAEHDALSASVLLTTDERLAEQVAVQLETQLAALSRQDIARKSIENNGAIVVVDSIDAAIEISNQIAPEHLELCFKDARSYLDAVQNAGAVFIGSYSPEPLGDYLAGANHVLPTGGTAKYFSVLNALTFVKRTSVTEFDRQALLDVSDDIIRLAECEGLTAHAHSIAVRRYTK